MYNSNSTEDYSKVNEAIKLLSQAWVIYAKNFPNGKNYNTVLRYITCAQESILNEYAEQEVL